MHTGAHAWDARGAGSRKERFTAGSIRLRGPVRQGKRRPRVVPPICWPRSLSLTARVSGGGAVLGRAAVEEGSSTRALGFAYDFQNGDEPCAEPVPFLDDLHHASEQVLRRGIRRQGRAHLRASTWHSRVGLRFGADLRRRGRTRHGRRRRDGRERWPQIRRGFRRRTAQGDGGRRREPGSLRHRDRGRRLKRRADLLELATAEREAERRRARSGFEQCEPRRGSQPPCHQDDRVSRYRIGLFFGVPHATSVTGQWPGKGGQAP